MRLLAWDTSSKSGAIVALEWDPDSEAIRREGWRAVRVASEWSLNVEATHSERLLWGIDQVLESARWKLAEVDAFGVGVGPGSFTGVRIGVTTARTLAHALGKPLIGVSSLAALARPVASWLAAAPESLRRPTVVVAATDACKGELFALYGLARSVRECAALADGDHPGLWKRGVEEKVLTPPELVKAIKRKLVVAGAQARWVAIGEGRRRYAEAWKELPAGRELALPMAALDQVQGRYLGALVWEAWQAGLGRAALALHPRYLRAADAELKLKAGLLKPAPTAPSWTGKPGTT